MTVQLIITSNGSVFKWSTTESVVGKRNMGVENGVKEEDTVVILEDADALIAVAVGGTKVIMF